MEKAREWSERAVGAGPDLVIRWISGLNSSVNMGRRHNTLCDVRARALRGRNQVTVRRGSQSPRAIKIGGKFANEFLESAAALH